MPHNVSDTGHPATGSNGGNTETVLSCSEPPVDEQQVSCDESLFSPSSFYGRVS